MKAQFIGKSVHVQTRSGAALIVPAQEILDLVRWGIDNEVTLLLRAAEAEKEQSAHEGGKDDTQA